MFSKTQITYRYSKRIRHAGHRISKLNTKLFPVVVQPASGDREATIETSNTGLSEEASQKISDKSANSVTGEDIQGIVVAEHEFELRSEVAQGTSHEAKQNGSSCCNVR